MKTQTNALRQSANADFKIDFRKWAWKTLSFWWLFLISLGIALPAGQAYLRYSTPLYLTKAKLLIKGVRGTSALSELSILSSDLEGEGKELTNEIEILRSRPVLTKVVEKLGIYVTYHRLGVIRDAELYTESPFLLSEYQLKENGNPLSFYITMGYDQQFRFKMHEDAEGEIQTFGEPFENQYGRFLLDLNKGAKLVVGDYLVNVMQSEDVANRYKSALVIESVGDKTSSILELKLIDQAPFKARDILNTLIEVYNEEEIADNVVILESTVSFVDDRIGRLSHELDSIESNIESFKSRNNIISESAESSLNFSLGELRNALSKLTELELERELLLALGKNLANNPESLIPTNISGDQPALTELINQYNDLFLRRKKLDETVSDEYPLHRQYTVQLNDLRGLIGRSLNNVKSNLEIPLAQARREIDQLQKNITSIPSVEKNLLDKLRLQSIKENLYLFLLQKKEETELSMAITRANTRIIEPARSSGGAFFPNQKITRLASVGLGLVVPVLIIILMDLIKVTVEDEQVIKGLTSIPVIGRIPHYKKGEAVLLKNGERSIRAEMFKLLRTNLDFANIDQKERVFVITSSMGGEGKSITAINLGITISLADKKVIVVDMDLRKPKIGKYLNRESKTGLTSFLVGEKPLSDVVTSHPDYPNLSFINSGPIPPNPTEMILSNKTGGMIEALKKEYDYVIIDCPPIGVVTDGLLLRPHMTNMLYVVRHKKTRKDSLKMMEELYQQGEFPNPGIIINDIEVSRHSQAYGGYHSGYGYGYYLNN